MDGQSPDDVSMHNHESKLILNVAYNILALGLMIYIDTWLIKYIYTFLVKHTDTLLNMLCLANEKASIL